MEGEHEEVRQAVSGPGLELHAGCLERGSLGRCLGEAGSGRVVCHPWHGLLSKDSPKSWARANSEEAARGVGSVLVWG